MLQARRADSNDAYASETASCSFLNDLQHLNTRGTASGYESYSYVPGTSSCNDINLSFVTSADLYRAVYQEFGLWRAGGEGWQRITVAGDVSPWRVLHVDKVTGNNHRSSGGSYGTTAHHRF